MLYYCHKTISTLYKKTSIIEILQLTKEFELFSDRSNVKCTFFNNFIRKLRNKFYPYMEKVGDAIQIFELFFFHQDLFG